MPSDVKSQFEDLAGKVSQGAEGVVKSLDNIVGAAGKADSSYGNLSKTQAASLEVSKKFKDATDNLAGSLKTLGDAGSTAAKGLASIGKVGESAVSSLATTMASASKDTAEMAKKIEELTKKIEKLEKAGTTASKVKFTIDTKFFKKAIDEIGDELVVLKNEAGKFQTPEIIDKKIVEAQVKVLKDVWDRLDDLKKKAIETEIASAGLGAAINTLAHGNDALAVKLATAGKKIKEEAISCKTLSDELKKVSSLTSLLKVSFVEGQKEAHEFAKGLGASGLGLMSVGVAAVFVSGKMAGVIDSFTDSAMALAKFNISASMMDQTMARSGSSLDIMRKQLKLTREQATEYFKVVREGTNVLGIMPRKLMEVSKALQDTFGGDPTERLSKYIDLLKEIPSLDTDLRVTASFDRESAALFALAEKGKMETVIEMQAAGVFGGGKMEFGDNKALLNAQQKTQGTMQGIHDTLLGFYPQWGPQFSAIASSTNKIFGAVGGLLAVAGAMKVFFGRGNAAEIGTWSEARQIRVNTAISAGTSNVPGPASAGKGKLGVKGAAIKMAKLGGVALALEGAAWGAESLSERFDKAGNVVGRDSAKIASSLAKVGAAAATGAIAGTALAEILPGVSTGLGALAGAAVGLYQEWDNLRGINWKDFGNAVSGIGATPGEAQALDVGRVQDELDNIIDPMKKFDKWVRVAGEGNKYVSLGTSKLGQGIYEWARGLDASGNVIKEQLSDQDKLIRSLGNMYVNFSLMGEQSRELGAAFDDNRKRTFESGLALQRTMSKLETATKSGIFQLVDFKKKLADVKIEALSGMGGSSETFNRAIEESSNALQKKFSMLGDAIKESREDIAKDGGLQGEARKQALMKVHAKEMEAVKEFTDGVGKLIEALFKSPAILKAGLEAELAKTKVEVPMEVGALTGEEIKDNLSKRMAALDEKLKGIMEARKDSIEKIIKAEATFDEEQQKRIAGLQKAAEAKGPEYMEKLVEKGILKKVKKPGAKPGEPEVEGFATDTEHIGQAVKETSKSYEEAADKIKKLRGQLDSTTPLSAALMLARYDGEIKRSTKSLGELQKAYEKADTADQADIREKIIKEEKQLSDANKAYSDSLAGVTKSVNQSLAEFGTGAGKNIKEKVAKFDPTKHGAAMKTIGKMAMKGEGFKKEDFEEYTKGMSPADADKTMKELQYIFLAMEDGMKKNKGRLEEVKKAIADMDEATDMQEAATGMALNLDMSVQATKSALETQKQFNSTLREINQVIADGAKIMEKDEIKALEVQLDVLNGEAALASQLGDPTQAVGQALSAQSNLIGEQLTTLQDTLKGYKKQLAVADELKKATKKEADTKRVQLESTKKALELAKKAAEGKGSTAELEAAQKAYDNARVISGMADDTATAAAASAGQLRKTTTELAKKAKELLDAFPKIGAAMSAGIEAFKNSLSGQKVQAKFDLSDALFEMARFSEQTGEMAKKATDAALDAAKERYEGEKKAIEEQIANEEKNNAVRVQAAKDAAKEAAEKAGKKPEEVTAAVEKAGKETGDEAAKATAAKKAAMLAKNEKDLKETSLVAVEKATKLQLDQLDAVQATVQAQLNLFDGFGKTAAELSGLLTQDLDIERDRLKAIKEQAAESRRLTGNSLETRKAEAEVVKKEAEIRNKELANVEKITKFQQDQLNVAQGNVQAQMDLFDTFGGSADELGGILNKDLKIEKKRLKLLKEQAAESRRLGGDSLKTQQLELDVTKKEAEIKKKDLDNAKKIIDLRRQEVDLQDQMLQTQLDVALEFGSSLSVVMDLQVQQVENAKKMRDLAQESYDLEVAKGTTGAKLMEVEVKLRQAEANLIKKSYGVQRDIMEKMLGSALGAARTSVGARRQRGTDVGLMGYEKSRMKTRSGMLMSAGPGGVKPLWQRQAEMKQAGKGARRMKPEEEMAAGLRKTAKSTDETAKATKATAEAVGSPGSAYTHDVTAEGLLASILYVAQDMAVGIYSLNDDNKNADDYRKKLAKGIEAVQSEVKKDSLKAASKATGSGVGDSMIAYVDEMLSTQQEGNDADDKINTVEKKMAKDEKESLKIQKNQLKLQKKEVAAQKAEDKKGVKVSSMDGMSTLEKEMAISTDLLKQGLNPDDPAFDAAMKKALDAQKETTVVAKEQEKTLLVSTDKGAKTKKTEQAKTADAWERIRGAQERAEKSGLGRPSKVKTIGDTFKAFREGSKSIIDSGKNIKRMGGGAGGGLAGGGKGIKRMGGGLDVTKMGGKKDLGSVAMIGFDSASKDMAKSAEAAKETVLSSSDIAGIAAKQTSMEAVGGGVQGSKMMEAKPQFGAGGTAVGGQGGTAEMGKMRIEGQMNVHFDNQAFKDEIASVVATLMKTPDFAKSVQQMAFGANSGA